MQGNPDASFDRIPARYRIHARLACIQRHIGGRSHVGDKQQASLYIYILPLNIHSNKLHRHTHRARQVDKIRLKRIERG